MARYISLLRFTSQGVRNLKKSPARAAAFRKAAERTGVKIEAQVWTNGNYDGVLILSAANQTIALKAIANPATGETVGDTAQFEAQADWLKSVGEFPGMVTSIDIKGTPFTNVALQMRK